MWSFAVSSRIFCLLLCRCGRASDPCFCELIFGGRPTEGSERPPSARLPLRCPLDRRGGHPRLVAFVRSWPRFVAIIMGYRWPVDVIYRQECNSYISLLLLPSSIDCTSMLRLFDYIKELSYIESGTVRPLPGGFKPPRPPTETICCLSTPPPGLGVRLCPSNAEYSMGR